MEKNTLDALVRVEVSAEPVIAGRSGSNDRGPYTIPAKQVCYIHQGDSYPTRIEVPFPDTGPRKPGLYLLAGAVFAVGVVGKYARVIFTDQKIDLISLEDVAAGLAKAPALKAA